MSDIFSQIDSFLDDHYEEYVSSTEPPKKTPIQKETTDTLDSASDVSDVFDEIDQSGSFSIAVPEKEPPSQSPTNDDDIFTLMTQFVYQQLTSGTSLGLFEV